MQRKNGGLAAWKARQRDFQKSGMTRRAYCEKNGIKLSTLDYWFSRIRKAEETHALVEIKPAPLQAANAAITVTMGRFRVEINDVAAVGALVQTLKALESSG